MKKILILNNYSITKVRKEIAEGLKPSNHLYGVIELENAGYELIILDPIKKGFWFSFGNILAKLPLCNIGDLNIQIRALLIYKKYDIVYGLSQDVTILLGFLSYLTLFRKPIIAIGHHPFLNGKLKRLRLFSLYFSLRGHKFFPALSSVVANQINLIACKNISNYIPWGPDIKYYDNQLRKHFNNDHTEKNFDFVCIGRTGRDFITFVHAVSQTQFSALVYCPIIYKEYFQKLGIKNVSLHFLYEEEPLTYPDIIQLYSMCKVIAIPTNSTNSLVGLTSIADATALGMPILITINSFLELDVEKESIGYLVNINDVNDWKLKMNQIIEHNLQDMQIKSREYAHSFANHKIFSNLLLKFIQQC
jgi:glycosyltransferase involved in cell wall biosynthesis